MELRLKFWGTIPETVLSFLDVNGNQKFSPKLTEWFFIMSILVIPNPASLKVQLQTAEREYVSMLGPRSKRWPYFFGLEPGRVMFWEGSKTFKTTHYPSSLLQLYLNLCKYLPFADLCPDCLPTFYKTGRIRLSLHQDKFGEKVVGHRELVILLFEGSPRQLLISWGNFERKIDCTPDVTVVLTPCANKFFWHGKLPSLSSSHAVTFAFRKGLSP